MTAREKFETAKTKTDEIRQQIDALYEEQRIADKETNEAFQDLLIEEKILGQKSWALTFRNDKRIELVCDAYSSDWKELSQFVETNYHCTFSLNTTDYISFDDGEISISIASIEHLKYLINKYSIKVHMSTETERQIKEMTETLAGFHKWQESFSQ